VDGQAGIQLKTLVGAMTNQRRDRFTPALWGFLPYGEFPNVEAPRNQHSRWTRILTSPQALTLRSCGAYSAEQVMSLETITNICEGAAFAVKRWFWDRIA